MSAPEPDVPEIEPRNIVLELNEEGQYVDAETGELAVVTPFDATSDLMPDWLIAQHYGGVPPTLPGSPIPLPPS